MPLSKGLWRKIRKWSYQDRLDEDYHNLIAGLIRKQVKARIESKDHILDLVSTPKYVSGGVFLMLYSSLRI